ncbi:MAG: hypothetical protein HN742_04340 [Lentisphaerae bacterium]|jgi:hypothetical protein|nr:hypothetical protein [Lentisphaerota bacterium]MBT5609157.1 hypothetical protein [Lentisphaerota bacterium]MBT7054163.1 hypothetical protein [Lentisphaerota bacterium]MBT7841073.1 hypothetical protein [Lentisphaerota bacterium]
MLRWRDSVVVLGFVACVCSSGAVDAQEATLKRTSVGPFRLYYTDRSPGSVLLNGEHLIRGIYLYTAVKPVSGKYIEGFNFRRDEDGHLSFEHEQLPDGVRMVWKNKRHVRDRKTRRAKGLAGEGTVTLTATEGGELSIRYQAKIEPNVGFGEIGFYLDERVWMAGEGADLEVVLADGSTKTARLPLPPQKARSSYSGFSRLTARSQDVEFDLRFDGTGFPGAFGIHFQDFRKSDQHPGCYRVVTNFDTKAGNTIDYTWRLRVTDKRPPAVQEAAHQTSVPPPPEGWLIPAIDPTFRVLPLEPASEQRKGQGGCSTVVSASGVVSAKRGDALVIRNDYTTLPGRSDPECRETVQGDTRQTTVRWDSPVSTIVKQVVASPGEMWLMWTVTAKKDTKGEVGVYLAASELAGPSISYRATNQSMVAAKEEPELGATYCLINGPSESFTEIQCGAGGHGDWQLQDFRSRGGRYRFVAVPRLKAGQVWRGVFRYSARPEDRYPDISSDAARTERGILATLLPDVIEDGFTIVPERASRYVMTGQPLRVRLKYMSPHTVSRKVSADIRLIDMWGRTAGETSLAFETGGQRFCAQPFTVATPTNGAYRLEMTYRCGPLTRTRELIFTVLPSIPETGLRPDSVFGAALAGGDYIGTLAKRIGLKWNRCHCAIGDTQAGYVVPERGKYTFDRIERGCEYHEKFDFWACHSISEGWKAKWLNELWKAGDFDAYMKAWIEDYVRPMAQHFKGRIRYWEVTNEPYYQYRECPEKWVRLMKETYETLKEVDPGCTVVGTCGPPGSMGYGWYRRTFALGSLDYQDAVSSHLYHWGPWVGSGVALSVRKWMREIRGVMAEHGRVVPLINSETTVTPPSSMYTHPSHTRYVRYHPGESPSDPIEQAQTYGKVLAVHKAEDVPYSFHIFHGGVEYTSHTGEYDETPLGFLATQAALAKYLEEAEYVQDISLGNDLHAFLFKARERLIVMPWGPMFLKGDWASVELSLPANRFEVRDVFDNPMPLPGDGPTTRLPITWQSYFLLAPEMKAEELVTAFAAAEVQVHFSAASLTAIKGTFGGENAGPAKRSDWIGFKAVDLSKVANRSFADETPGDGEGGWTDEGENDMRFLPTGEWLINGVPFRIMDAEENNGASCLVLSGGVQGDSPFPERVNVPVNGRLSTLHFLHTVTWGSRSGPGFSYVLHFADGVTEEVVVEMQKNVADWWWQGNVPAAKVAWEGPNKIRENVRLYHVSYDVQHPKGAQAVLERIEIISAKKRPIPVIVAITGVHSN